MGSTTRIDSLKAAAVFVDQVGIAVAWGKADLVLPSLWREIGGPDGDWAIRDKNGKPTGFSPEFDRLWRWKDELPERRLACAGKHFGSAALLIAPRLLAAAYALTGRSGTVDDFRKDELETLERRAFFIESADGAPFMADAAEAIGGGALRLSPGTASCAVDVKMPGPAPAEPGMLGDDVLLISRRVSWSPRRPRC